MFIWAIAAEKSAIKERGKPQLTESGALIFGSSAANPGYPGDEAAAAGDCFELEAGRKQRLDQALCYPVEIQEDLSYVDWRSFQ
jgi:hypothetical protein